MKGMKYNARLGKRETYSFQDLGNRCPEPPNHRAERRVKSVEEAEVRTRNNLIPRVFHRNYLHR